MSAKAQESRRVKALADVLDEQAGLYDALLKLFDEKITAMRSADMRRVDELFTRQQSLVARIQDRETLRRRLVENLVRPYGQSVAGTNGMAISAIAKRFGGNQTQRLLDAASRLKALTQAISRRNHMVRLISEGILRHMKQVFDAMTGADAGHQYAADGAVDSPNCNPIFDAVG